MLAQLVIRRSLARASLSLLLSAVTSVGCAIDAAKAPPLPEAPVDEWIALPKSSQWLHAVADFSGTRKEECAEVEKWIKGEDGCQASSCENGRDLARDWLSRCTKLAPDAVAGVKEALGKYRERAEQPDSPCVTQLKPLLEGKCGQDKTCEGPAQKWATRCVAREGSPLAARILARFVQRRIKEPRNVELDLRTCDDLRADAAAGVSCENKFKCEDAVAKIELYRGRCEDEGEQPPVALALAEMTIFAAAEQKVEPLLARADDDASAPIRAKLPPLLADGSGVVVSVCGTRVASFDAYLTARKECEAGGAVVFARAFKLPGVFEVRMGRVPPADTAVFAARYPSLLLAGEHEKLEKDHMAAFDAQLAAAAKLAQDPKTALDGGRALLQLLRERGRELRRSEPMRAAISAKDAAFLPALKEIGKAKATWKASKAELSSIALRGQKHALADLDTDAGVRFGAVSWGALFDTAVLLPQAHAEYLKAMKPLLKKTEKDKAPEEADVDEARAFGTLAEDCQGASAKAKKAEQALVECAFGQRTCDAAQVETLEKELETSRTSSENAFVAVSIFQMTAAGAAAEYYKKIMATAECSAPSW